MKKVKVLAYLTLCCLFFNSVMADEMEPGYVNDSYISTDIVENDNNDLYIDDDEEQGKLIEETSILDESILEDTTEVVEESDEQIKDFDGDNNYEETSEFTTIDEINMPTISDDVDYEKNEDDEDISEITTTDVIEVPDKVESGFCCDGIARTPKEIIDKIPVAKLDKQRERLPEVLDLSEYFPQPGAQHEQGSCVGWALGYYMKTAQEAMERGWKPDDQHRIFSPSYIYNQINGGIDGGSYITDGLELLKNQGVCSVYDMPYDFDDCFKQPDQKQMELAQRYKIKSYEYIDVNQNKEYIQIIKQNLAKHNLVVICVDEYNDLKDLNEGTGNIIYDTKDDEFSGLRHALCLVGYDDDKNAFKFINSWRKPNDTGCWGYVDYDFMLELNTEAYVVYDEIEPLEGISGFTYDGVERDEKIYGDTYSITLKNLQTTNGAPIGSVKFPTWSEKNGQDDLIWYEGTQITGTNDWKVTINTSKHGNDGGNYYTHIYGKLGNQDDVLLSREDINLSDRLNDKFLYGCGIIVCNIEDDEITAVPDTYGRMTLTAKNVRFEDGTYPEYYKFCVWTENDGQDDLKWYNAKKIFGTNDWTCTVDFYYHNREIGKYNIHCYAGNLENECRCYKTTSTNIEETIYYSKFYFDPGVQDNKIYNDRYKVYIGEVRSITGTPVTNVQFPTWTENNGQDDLSWGTSNNFDTNYWYTEIKLSDHNNENGKYTTHIYATTKYGTFLIKGVDCEAIGSTYDKIDVVNNGDDSYTLTVVNLKYKDGNTPTFVKLPVWTDKGGQDDLVWYDATKINNTNNWEINIKKSEHNNEIGTYIVDVYTAMNNFEHRFINRNNIIIS